MEWLENIIIQLDSRHQEIMIGNEVYEEQLSLIRKNVNNLESIFVGESSENLLSKIAVAKGIFAKLLTQKHSKELLYYNKSSLDKYLPRIMVEGIYQNNYSVIPLSPFKQTFHGNAIAITLTAKIRIVSKNNIDDVDIFIDLLPFMHSQNDIRFSLYDFPKFRKSGDLFIPVRNLTPGDKTDALYKILENVESNLREIKMSIEDKMSLDSAITDPEFNFTFTDSSALVITTIDRTIKTVHQYTDEDISVFPSKSSYMRYHFDGVYYLSTTRLKSKIEEKVKEYGVSFLGFLDDLDKIEFNFFYRRKDEIGPGDYADIDIESTVVGTYIVLLYTYGIHLILEIGLNTYSIRVQVEDAPTKSFANMIINQALKTAESTLLRDGKSYKIEFDIQPGVYYYCKVRNQSLEIYFLR